MELYEKLGAFYLGRLWDPEARSGAAPLLYDAKDLTTHAVCVGMTGSGKTGLCLALLEEAAIDGVPAIAIDPKGDLANLLLTFPDLRPADFRPWIDDGEAARKGQTPEEYAATIATRWREGLAQWGQDGERIRRLRASADFALYTPGSSAGAPLQVLRSFAVPSPAVLANAEDLRDRVQAAVAGLLVLLGIDADPLRSREQILLSNLLQHAWAAGRDLDLPALIREIQSPPIQRVGVMELESFYPSKDRFGLAMAINNLLASPGFAAWLEGEPLDVGRLLWTAGGRPRLSILSIAHLSDAERMFFVTLLLNEVVSWMRSQPGTPSLRAILYMDEVFGYLPPTAEPPSKRPMLTLLKQARAYGLGVVLATQNPVDLDYKALSNTGTWFLGRLQTERDKLRILDGLEGASASTGQAFDRAAIERTLSGLESRVFLMNNVHDAAPALFQTRWAMSYLRGPLTRAQLAALSVPAKEPRVAEAARAEAAAAPGAVGHAAPPVLPAGIEVAYLPCRALPAPGERLLYKPALLGTARLHFVRAASGLDLWRETTLLAPLDERTAGDPWEDARVLDAGASRVAGQAEAGATFADLPAEAGKAASYTDWAKSLSAHLYRSSPLRMWSCAALDARSEPGETEGEFRARLAHAARERRDRDVAKLEERYKPKLARIEERIRRADQKVERERSQYGQQKVQAAISVGATVLGALFGRKVASAGTVGRATTALRGAGRAAREREDIARAEDDAETQRQALEELEAEFEGQAKELRERYDPAALELSEVEVPPRKSDIAVERVTLVWTPWRGEGDIPLFLTNPPGDL